MAQRAGMIVVTSRGPDLLIRFLWFVFVGWWLGAVVSGLARFLVLTVLGLPLGLWLINRLPAVITPRPQEQGYRWDDRPREPDADARDPQLLRVRRLGAAVADRRLHVGRVRWGVNP